MAISDLDRDKLRQLLADAILGPTFLRATFGGAARGRPTPWIRVLIRPVELQSERWLQFSYFDPKKDITRNFRLEEARVPLDELIELAFAGIHITTAAEEIDVRNTKKGKVLIGRKASTSPTPAMTPLGESHNRTKDLPLPEGRANRVLEVMGILTWMDESDQQCATHPDQRVPQASHSHPERCRIANSRARCGNPRLRLRLELPDLSVHHYLNDVLSIPAHCRVDVNEELIRKSTARAERLSMSGLAFECGRIRTLMAKPDIVLALHACDTASDDAIAQAILTEATIFLGVPCCHQNLNHEIRAEGDASVLRPILRHGILLQRSADLVTDAFRALILRIMGYRTDVVEFVGTEHTARNLMIRAVRGASRGDAEDIRQYLEMRSFWNTAPYLERLLGAEFQRLLT